MVRPGFDLDLPAKTPILKQDGVGVSAAYIYAKDQPLFPMLIPNLHASMVFIH